MQKIPTETIISAGVHGSLEDGACAMELVSYLAQEPWTDEPKTACPVITTFVNQWNNGMSDEEATSLLLPLVPKIVGTRATLETEASRGQIAVAWFTGEALPALLKLAPPTREMAMAGGSVDMEAAHRALDAVENPENLIFQLNLTHLQSLAQAVFLCASVANTTSHSLMDAFDLWTQAAAVALNLGAIEVVKKTDGVMEWTEAIFPHEINTMASELVERMIAAAPSDHV